MSFWFGFTVVWTEIDGTSEGKIHKAWFGVGAISLSRLHSPLGGLAWVAGCACGGKRSATPLCNGAPLGSGGVFWPPS
jgi:hypothetical protein